MMVVFDDNDGDGDDWSELNAGGVDDARERVEHINTAIF